MYFFKTEQTTKDQRVTYLNELSKMGDAPADFMADGHTVETVPQPEANGHNYQLMYNPTTDSLYYEYTAPPPSPESLQQQIDDLTMAMADMMGGALS
jgi:hypothetical protein